MMDFETYRRNQIHGKIMCLVTYRKRDGAIVQVASKFNGEALTEMALIGLKPTADGLVALEQMLRKFIRLHSHMADGVVERKLNSWVERFCLPPGFAISRLGHTYLYGEVVTIDFKKRLIEISKQSPLMKSYWYEGDPKDEISGREMRKAGWRLTQVDIAEAAKVARKQGQVVNVLYMSTSEELKARLPEEGLRRSYEACIKLRKLFG